MDLSALTIAQARKDLDEKKYSALDLAEAYLAEIEKRDPELHAYLEVWTESARAEAKAADEMIAERKSQPLTGIPIAIKDNILIHGRIASSASKILEHYRASYDATVITKLKEQGVVFLGRTNMDEFALGSSTENSAYGPTKNPHDTSRVPGGTSGGSAAALAAHLCLGALGSDTGGSIRQPAALCGVVGMKPTYGKVSRFGLMAAASSLDQIGPIANTVEDARIIYDAIKGHDPHDSTSLLDADSEQGETLLKKVVGVPRAFLKEGTEPDVMARFEEALKKLEAAGYEIRDVELPHLKHSLAVYYIINPAEVSTNLDRFDGIRYGLSKKADTIGEVYAKTRGEGLGPEARRRTLVGTFVLSSGYYDAYYRKARAVRALIRQDFIKAFESVDAIATPTAPTPAFKFGEMSDPVAMYAGDIFSVPANLAGIPAMSLPMGTVERSGSHLPTGFQLSAGHGCEDILFEVGSHLA